ncbi:MAG: tetratricopeptide repeat protein [Wenzhouxiangellaceae bacterium]
MDNALLRFGLGQAWLNQGEAERAASHLQQALAQQPDYTAAWKLLGKAQTQLGQDQQAITTFTSGIACAEKQGDQQALKEMQVLRRRLVGKDG